MCNCGLYLFDMFIIVCVSFMFFLCFFYFSLLFFLHLRGSIARVLSQGSLPYLFLDFLFVLYIRDNVLLKCGGG